MNTNFNGICYAPFPRGYTPSIANHTYVFYGSDMSYTCIAPVWGKEYTSKSRSHCDLNGPNKARNDIQTLANMGVKLIRLYDWHLKNDHLGFLDYCDSFGIKVLASVSNYFVKPGEGLPQRNDLIPGLIDSYSNKDKTDYHSAIIGIVIGNEPTLNDYNAQNCIDFTTSWANIEASNYANYREVIIGHPVDFGTYGAKYPCFGFWDPLFAALDQVTTKNLNKRLFLAPQTYNDRQYLFENAESSGRGYVDIAYDKYQKPILFTEIGHDRTKPNYQNIVQGQLSGSINYAANNPNKLIGICFFQFADKVWIPGTSDGSHGTHSQGNDIMCTINFDNGDFTHWDENCQNVLLTVNNLIPTPLYDIVVQNYKTS
ncbi:hypothetical protein [Flavobacterium sp. KACC 22763]|uniref:hypothetical protein n=1 Tax=Flavobacterium sp. KACC 22763 TaxID=3025668 RepID=UPI0023669AFB|nr:hypothetical protein [Flavobacterium sp. KACC 22763]WDF65961.1 hypothetical protein PQ463_07260 [Flavobacterium sp. KACC 22763]